MRPVGIGLGIVGGILLLIGFIWGWGVGFYLNELPVIIVLLVAGGGLVLLGSRLAASSRTPEPPTFPLASASVPRVAVPVTPQVPPTVTPEQLAELAASRPDLWDEIAAHPNAYDALRAWIASERAAAIVVSPAPAGAITPADDAVRRASDPATTPEELADLAHRHPELRPAIAANPAAYPALRDWIASMGGRA